MDAMIIFGVMIAGFVCIGIIVAYFVWQRDKKYMESLKAFALSNGFTYSPKVTDLHMAGKIGIMGVEIPLGKDQTPSWLNFDECKVGYAHEVRHLLTKTEGLVETRIFRFSYDVPSGKSSHTIFFFAIVIRPEKVIPQFIIKPEGLFQKVLNAVGFKDINFDSNPEFSKKFLLKGVNESSVRAIFTPEVQRYFLTSTRLNEVASNGEYLLFLGAGLGAKPDEFSTYLASANELIGLFPEMFGLRDQKTITRTADTYTPVEGSIMTN